MWINEIVIPVDTELWLVPIWRTNTVLIFFINGFGVYIILRHSTKEMAVYKYFLLNLLIWAFIADLVYNSLFCLGLLFPLEGIYMSPACLFAHSPPSWIWPEMIFSLIVVYNCNLAIVNCFLSRLWAIEGHRWGHGTPFRQTWTALCLHLLFSIRNGYAVGMAALDRETQIRYVKEHYPNSHHLLNMTNWVIMPAEISRLHKILWAWVIEFSLFTAIIFFSVFRVIYGLSSSKVFISRRMHRAQKSIIKSLIIQAFLSTLVYFFPTVDILFCALMVDFKYYVEKLTAVFYFHSNVNTITMCFIISPYRKAIKTLLQKALRRILKRMVTESEK